MKNYSRQEVADIFKVSLYAVAKWEQKKVIKSFQNESGLIRYKHSELANFAKKRIISFEAKIEKIELVKINIEKLLNQIF